MRNHKTNVAQVTNAPKGTVGDKIKEEVKYTYNSFLLFGWFVREVLSHTTLKRDIIIEVDDINDIDKFIVISRFTGETKELKQN